MCPKIVDYVGGSFSLTFIDPAGWTGFGLQRIRPLLELPGEVIINFMLDFVNRFLDDPRPEIAATLDPLFGGSGWNLEVESRVKNGETREDAILAVYCVRLRQFGQFPHVRSTRILKPLADRSYFHLVYGTRHWKGLVEFQRVEKMAVSEQERVRGSAKILAKIERTQQEELFASVDHQTGPRSFESERKKQLEAGYVTLRSILASERSLRVRPETL